MTKIQFRFLIVTSILLTLMTGIYDYLWTDPITSKITEYAYELEPEMSVLHLAVLSGVLIIAFLLAIVSFVGFVLFKSWAKPLYLAGFVLFLPLYPFLGVTVTSGISQILYDLSVMSSGAILALLYFSPVAKYYQKLVNNY